MNNNKLVLKYCPNFYKIVNMDFQEGDNISNKLVDIYEDFIFKADLSNEDNINLIKEIDHVLNSYIEDNSFRNKVQRDLLTVKVKRNGKDILTSIVEAIVGMFNKYIEETTRKIYIARWI
ncbi:MAG: hypothetical protein E7158_06590 [Firmicutes bacterium]|nr:hypothetical protein [Bacillota bacterium]